jgi:hypothetical protein
MVVDTNKAVVETVVETVVEAEKQAEKTDDTGDMDIEDDFMQTISKMQSPTDLTEANNKNKRKAHCLKEKQEEMDRLDQRLDEISTELAQKKVKLDKMYTELQEAENRFSLEWIKEALPYLLPSDEHDMVVLNTSYGCYWYYKDKKLCYAQSTGLLDSVDETKSKPAWFMYTYKELQKFTLRITKVLTTGGTEVYRVGGFYLVDKAEYFGRKGKNSKRAWIGRKVVGHPYFIIFFPTYQHKGGVPIMPEVLNSDYFQ